MKIEPAASLVGHLGVPGDKSISHRAVLLAAVSEGETRIEGFGRSEDTETTIEAVRALGATVYEADADTLRVFGVGLRGLSAPAEAIDCRNAGTLMRLLPGLLAGQTGRFVLTGDDSLRSRPMERIAVPLRRMGVRIATTEGTAPLTVAGGEVRALSYELPVASAQVKSAILLAGLYARAGETTVVEPLPTRDHTESLLAAAGARLERRQGSATVWPADRLELGEIEIPGDFSSAAPFLVAATLLSGSQLTLHGVNLNPRRTGLLDVLERMGGNVTVYNRRRIAGEPAGDLDVRPAQLVGTQVTAGEVPSLVDELPLFALLAVHARGDGLLSGAAELRAKETDRIDAVVSGLRRLGAHIRATEDGFVVRGVPARLRGGTMDARGDHRVAILAAVAGLASREGVAIEGADSAAVSFPGFYSLVENLAVRGFPLQSDQT
ncbi:MAG: 3-phosphoshikimate 1-carboxyvinyltransferase [Actinomycetota bacterium]|nr:3-phosphoshikimate 1-carboxyvinyltransferase [Actinomycetota bacterium]